MPFQLTDNSYEGKVKFLMSMGVDSGRAQRVANNGAQFNDYLRDFNNGLARFTQDAEKSIGGYFNAIASTKADMTPARKEAERQNTLNRTQSGNTLKKALQENYDYMNKLIKSGASAYMTPDVIDNFNTLLANAAKVDSSLKFAPVAGGTGKIGTTQDMINNVTNPGSGSGSSSTPSSSSAPTGSTSPSSFTGWAKMAYEKALKLGGSPADYAPSFVKNSPVHSETLSRISQAVDAARQQGTASGGTASSNGTDYDGMQDALDSLEQQYQSGSISRETYDLFKLTLENWDPNSEVNPANIVKAFQSIKETSIDPYYRGLMNLGIETVKNSSEEMLKQRSVELENEGLDAETALEVAKADLETRGLYFSGSARKQLGGDSAFAQGTENTTGTIPFGGAPVEGYVNKKNRLISTSSKARYDAQRRSLGLEAESTLGSNGISGLLPDYTAVGGVLGDIPYEKQQKEGATLNSLIDQQAANIQQNQLLDTDI